MKQLSLFFLLWLKLSISSSIEAQYHWETRRVPYRGKTVKLVILNHLDITNFDSVLEIIDRSAEGTDPLKVNNSYTGLIREDDLICVNEKLLFWFSATEKNKRSVRTGGGMLSGIWEIILIDRTINLKTVESKSAYSPNLLLPGSKPGLKLFGSDIYGGYADKDKVWGLENADHLREGPKLGKNIIESDRGPYSAHGGVFIEFIGVVKNSGTPEEGFETEYDTDPRPGKIGRTTFELLYRIPANRMEIIQEIKFTVEENNFGPISAAYMALYLPGYDDKNMVYVSNPELTPRSEGINLNDVYLNKYFRNTAVKKVFFYDIPHVKHPLKKYSAQTTEGRGRILCLGSPENFIHFICGYPTNNFIPKEAYNEYTLEITYNQTMPKYGKFHSLNYKLISTPHKSILLEKDSSFMMIMRYKFIDASIASAAVEYREKNGLLSEKDRLIYEKNK